jgi:uncharacterized membrane protein
MNALYPLFGVREPLTTVPSIVTITSLTLVIFLVSQRKDIGRSLNVFTQDFPVELDTRGVILCALSILLLLLSVVGALYANTFLLISAIIGIAAFFVAGICSSKLMPSRYHMFVLFAISLSLLFQASLISRHIMGYDIFGEYYAFNLVKTAGYWSPPGVVVSYTESGVLNSVLSITILPTIYSAILDLNGELIFKTIFPFFFALVPLFLYKIYESQSGKLAALLSVFFFIAETINFYGLESLSLAREMIAYLFFSAAIFSLLHPDMNTRNKRILIITFSAGLAVSHYSISFIYVFYMVFAFIALRARGTSKKSLDFPLVICIIAITFAWYMYVSSPPLNKLIDVIHNISQNLAQDLFNPQARLPSEFDRLSPTVQTDIVGLIHKILIYITHCFIVVGVVILAIKPKKLRFNPEFRWMAIFAALILLACFAVPNLAPTLNISRFYRATMIFLEPLLVVGGMYFLGLFERIRVPSWVKFGKVTFKDLRMLTLTIVLVSFFLFRIGLVNHIAGGYPTSFSLDFGRMKTSTNLGVRTEIFSVSVSEQDLFGATWLAAEVENASLVYADYGRAILFDYTDLRPENIGYLVNDTQMEPSSYIYLRRLNVVEGLVSTPTPGRPLLFNLSDISLLLTQSNKIYSNGQSETYSLP